MSLLRRCFLVAAALFAPTAAGCGEDIEAPHGSPVLLEVVWQVEGVPMLAWSGTPDAAVAAALPAAAFKIDFVFDRRLDGARIEDSVNDRPVPKANPPIKISWPDMATAMSDPPFGFDVFYSSLPTWGAGTTSAFVQAHAAGFPSATPITFTLDPNGLTSVYGEPMIGPPEITVTTEPLAVSLAFSTATVATSYRAPIVFSTRGPAPSVLKGFVQVSALGQALPFDIAYDVANPKRALITSGCGAVWPAGVRVEVTVDAGAPDGFGQPLAAPAKGSFMTAPIASVPVDGSCGFDRDAGIPDTGTADGGTPEGGVVDAGVPDVGLTDTDVTDAGTPEADAAADAAQPN